MLKNYSSYTDIPANQESSRDNEAVEFHSDGVNILGSMKGCSPLPLADLKKEAPSQSCCSGTASAIGSSEAVRSHERPGYLIAHFVEDFISTEAGDVPVTATKLKLLDRIGTIGARTGISRSNYRVAPGLYAVGKPDRNSEVLVTANFKLTFDTLRKNLSGIDAWILVLNTFGINVWCAAGKGSFSTDELVLRIKSVSLENVVDHRRVILPQLGATGVRAKDVKKRSGFSVVYGPVRAEDIVRFLNNERKADMEMRQVSFNFSERLVLTPVEIYISLKYILITSTILFLISGIGPGIFSFENSLERGFIASFFLLSGLFSGAVAVPAFLPLIPFREFAAKGLISGILISAASLLLIPVSGQGGSAIAALLIFGTTASSWFAMNFTGSTPFTSPSGVEKEMKRYIPIQAVALMASLTLWLFSAFHSHSL